MTTFAEFQEYYLREIWRTGDSDLTTDLPRLIKKAEARIKRDLREQGLVSTFETTITDGREVDLPADFSELVSYDLGKGNVNSVVSYPELHTGCYFDQGPVRGPAAILGNKMYFRGSALTEAPATIRLTYQMGIVPYDANPAIPFYDQHPDFYVAALNVYVYEYLREFENKASNDQTYMDLLDSMTRNSNYARFPSGQIALPMPI